MRECRVVEFVVVLVLCVCARLIFEKKVIKFYILQNVNVVVVVVCDFAVAL